MSKEHKFEGDYNQVHSRLSILSESIVFYGW